MSKRKIEAGGASILLGVKDRLDKGLRAGQAKLRAFAGGVAGIGAKLGAAGGAITAPFAAGVSLFTEMGDTLDKMAGRTAFAVETLSELGFAAEQSGGDLATLEKGIFGLSRAVFDASRGSKMAADALKEIGISADDLIGLSAEQQFYKVADGLAAIKDESIRGAVAQKLFGRSGRQLLPMLAGGAEGINKLRAEARALGLTVSTETAGQAAKLTDAFNVLRRTSKQIAFTLGSAVADDLLVVTKRAAGFVVAAIDWSKRNKELLATIAKIGVAITGVGMVLGGIAAAAFGGSFVLGGLSSALGLVGSVLGAILSPAGLVVGAIAGATVAFFKFTSAGADLAAFLRDKFGGLLSFSKKVFGGIAAALMSGDFRAAGAIAWNGLLVAARGAWRGIVELVELLRPHVARVTSAVGAKLAGWFGWLVDIHATAWSAIRADAADMLGAIRSAAGSAWQWIGRRAGDLAAAAGSTWSAIKTGAGSAFGWIKANAGELVGLLLSSFGGIGIAARALWGGITAAASASIGAVRSGAGGLVAGLVGSFGGLVSGASAAWGGIAAAAGSTWSAILSGGLGAVRTILSAFGGIGIAARAAWGGIAAAAASVWPAIAGAAGSAWSSIASAAASAAGSIRSGLAGLVAGLAGTWSGMLTAARGVWSGILGAAGLAWDFVNSSAGQAARTVLSAFGGIGIAARALWGGITAAAGRAWSAIAGGAGRVVEGVGAAWSSFTGWFSKMLGSIAEVGRNVWSNLGRVHAIAFSNIGQNTRRIARGIGQSFADASRFAVESFGGIANALMSGNLGMAAEIAWLSIRVAFQKGVAKVDSIQWELAASLHRAFSGVAAKIREIWGGLVAYIAKMLLRLRGLVDKSLDVEGAIEQIDQQVARSKAKAAANAEQTERKRQLILASKRAKQEAKVAELEERRQELLTQAEGERQQGTIFDRAADRLDDLLDDFKMPEFDFKLPDFKLPDDLKFDPPDPRDGEAKAASSAVGTFSAAAAARITARGNIEAAQLAQLEILNRRMDQLLGVTRRKKAVWG